MTKHIGLLFFILLLGATGFCGNDNFAAGGRQGAMGGCGVTLTDLWSVQQNQAGLAGLKTITAGVYYESKFMMPDLGLSSGAFALPIKDLGVFGLFLSDYGNKNYKEQRGGLTFAKSFGKLVSFGIQLDYLSTKLGEDYGQRSTVAAEAGVLVKITSKLDLGAHIYNPNRAKLAEYNDERVPTIMKMGMGYHFSPKVLATIEAEKDVDAKNVFKAGLEYQIVKSFVLRAGISSNPAVYSFGFGLNLKKFHIDAAASVHQVLGYSPKVSMSYDF